MSKKVTGGTPRPLSSQGARDLFESGRELVGRYKLVDGVAVLDEESWQDLGTNIIEEDEIVWRTLDRGARRTNSMLRKEATKMPKEIPIRPLDAAYRVLDEEGMLERSGSVLGSAEAALRKGAFYFLGLNPGGEDVAPDDPEARTHDYPTLADSLAASRLGYNAFDQDWSTSSRSFEPGQSPMQKNFKFVCRALGLCYSEVCASNFVFTRSPRVKGHPSWEADLRVSERVHAIFLDAVQPDFLWIQGNPDTVGLKTQMTWVPTEHGNWTIGHGTAEFCGKTWRACHTPHLSLWHPQNNRQALEHSFGPTGLLNPASLWEEGSLGRV